MKNIYFVYRLALGFGLLLAFSQCDKTVDLPVFEPYAETNLDANAGNWKTYVLTNGAEIGVPAPEAAVSAAYQTELADLKNKMAAATDEQKDLARHWGANGVLRWHAIARELAAQYNVPPNYNADGTYPSPDPMNPTVYPRFPFATPPYASRAFALLAVAQYDALVTAWHHKFQHNRLAPYKNDSDIRPLIPENDLPSYPSEDAVVAAASRELLKFLFPGEAARMTELAEEHKNSRLWAGANVQSDLDAGEALGVAVAARIINYAKTDRMGMANNQAGFQGQKDDAIARGITKLWTSTDVPARPPMLPTYGNVKTWNLDQATLLANRPDAPPQPGTPAFETALDELRAIAKNRTREQFRIASYWADGVGSYTPPGHWNRKAAELIYEKQYNEMRTARVMALLNTGIQDAGIACWDVKYYYLLPRPTEADPAVTTCTGIPNFPAYTSGHSSFSAAAAEVLSYLFPDKAAELDAMALEAANSRIYGCIHYRFDSEVGLTHGKKIGSFAVLRGQSDGSQ
ncbi:MAG: phosphatase PAP2 family protein [Lewinellaceae bacterium]|nr:phosphatase PAP2 family protein [Lewinellaceae bacterium]